MSVDDQKHEEVGTSRIEAFSGGVFAFDITLLILDIHVSLEPIPAGQGTIWLLWQLGLSLPSSNSC